jgi:hypothetical protein
MSCLVFVIFSKHILSNCVLWRDLQDRKQKRPIVAMNKLFDPNRHSQSSIVELRSHCCLNLQTARTPLVFAHLLYRFKMFILKHIFSLKLLAALVALVICIASLRLNQSVTGENIFTVHADVNWDLASAREQLLDRVHGQETAVQQLVDNLEWTRQQHKEVWDTASNASSIRVIFLLGGPGVGKTEVK